MMTIETDDPRIVDMVKVEVLAQELGRWFSLTPSPKYDWDQDETRESRDRHRRTARHVIEVLNKIKASSE